MNAQLMKNPIFIPFLENGDQLSRAEFEQA